jgi:5'-nucleotidase
LSHLGYEYADDSKISDVKLAKQTSNIDLILGGHTHTFLEKATLKKNKIDQQVLINQVGYAGLYLGRIDIDVTTGMMGHSIKVL